MAFVDQSGSWEEEKPIYPIFQVILKGSNWFGVTVRAILIKFISWFKEVITRITFFGTFFLPVRSNWGDGPEEN